MQSEFLGRKDSEKAHKILLRGNRHFRNVEYESAIEAFNASICHALPDTVEMRNGFYDRATVFTKIGLYNEALESIKLASEVKQSEEERNQLEKYKEYVLLLKKRLDGYKSTVTIVKTNVEPKLSHPAHANVPYASELIEIQENDQFGRYLTAKENLRPGTCFLLIFLTFSIISFSFQVTSF